MQGSIISLLKKHNISNPLLEIPPSPEMGDYAFPCFTLAKEFKKSPMEIAKDLESKIKPQGDIEKIQALGPYLNFFLDKSKRASLVLKKILKEKDKYGSKNLGKKQKFLIEHTSINPNASPHLGRARNAILGDSITRILRFQGYNPEVHYFVNDVGKQIALLVLGCKSSTTFKELLDIYIKMNKKLEQDPEIEKSVFQLLKKFEEGDKPTIKKFRKTVDICINGQKKIFEQMGIKYDFFDYESKYLFDKSTAKILESLKKTKYLFEDEDSRMVLNQKDFNLPMESPFLVLTRNDKTSLYPLRDLAYTLDKMERSKKNLIVLGEDQKLYFQQLKAALAVLKKPSPEVIHYSFVLLSGGKKMSTRKGNLVLLEDFLKEAFLKAESKSNKKIAKSVANSAIKYSFLKVSIDKNVLFNWSQALSFEGDTGPYLQYTYARSASILKKAKVSATTADLSLLKEPSEIELIKKLSLFPDLVEKASLTYQPHLIANYLFPLCQNFNEFYHKNPVIKAEPKLKASRLILVKSFNQTLKNSLNLLGIESLESM